MSTNQEDDVNSWETLWSRRKFVAKAAQDVARLIHTMESERQHRVKSDGPPNILDPVMNMPKSDYPLDIFSTPTETRSKLE
jgi:hypothetical protein